MTSLQWFGPPCGAPMNEDCEQVGTPMGEPCARCEVPIDGLVSGVMMWHALEDFSGYRPLHYACFMRGVTGGIDHVLRHGGGVCDGECRPDPDWLPRRDAAEIALRLWEAARLARGPDA